MNFFRVNISFSGKNSPAFTLIELLVVIAIIGILAAMILTAISKAKQKSHRIVCMGKLRQWGMATLLYVGDNDDYLPPDGSPNGTSINGGWYVDLPPYLSLDPYREMPWRTNASAPINLSLPWFCPANPRRSNGNNLFHYCLNEYVNKTGDENAPIRYTTVRRPSRMVWLFDSKNLPAVGYWNFIHTNIHGAGANILFLDGHVVRCAASEYWDFAQKKGRTNNPSLLWMQ
ncbi:MAG: prepilin-type N-terminal cleavage/methylation domain-containing protein [Verrucomicrobia bacterium]|nr:prepilin-type N-terminal cleavage/methylation domain-containing protein [Verrucomicrobiota bacterium]MBO7523874.1 prepilin-type N-terminal cleavage/methylation domain-containing protein [Verrucomicrobiota bacterium]MBP5760169.1 prepilin-type N-terminal cleavage/methylation domain-containing protein [Verrucomicrobiota bacterium]